MRLWRSSGWFLGWGRWLVGGEGFGGCACDVGAGGFGWGLGQVVGGSWQGWIAREAV